MRSLKLLEMELGRCSREQLLAHADVAVRELDSLVHEISSFPRGIEPEELSHAHASLKSMLRNYGITNVSLVLQGSRWYGNYLKNKGIEPRGDVHDIDVSVFGLPHEAIQEIKRLGKPELNFRKYKLELHPAFLVSQKGIENVASGEAASDHLAILKLGVVLSGWNIHHALVQKVKEKVKSFNNRELSAFILRTLHHIKASEKGRVIIDHRRYYYVKEKT